MSQQFPSQYPQQQQQPPQWQGQPIQQEQWQQQPPPGMYPHQQPPMQPPKKSRRGLWIGLGVVAVVVLALCISVAAVVNNAAKNVQSSVNTALTTVATGTSVPATAQHHKVGETVTGSTWQVAVANVKIDTKGDQFTQPKAGDVFVVVHVVVKNVSGQSETLSSLGNFTFRDTNGNTFTEEIGLGDKYTAPDGAVNDGEQLQGDLVYQVPTGTKDYILYFQESSFGSSIAEWDVHTA